MINGPGKGVKRPFTITLVLLAILTMATFWINSQNTFVKTVDYSDVLTEINAGNVTSISYQPDGSTIQISGEYKKPIKETKKMDGVRLVKVEQTVVYKRFSSTMLMSDVSLTQLKDAIKDKNVKVAVKPPSQTGFIVETLINVVVVGGVLVLLFVFMSKQGGGAGGPMAIVKNRAKLNAPTEVKIRFSDVAGAEEEKQELVEIVEFLKDPGKFKRLGARIPTGVLLEGPPGTGKTLLAKAVAGEAGVPFFSISGSDFVEMFVGVGAGRVRSLFEDAKKAAPAIIFIDEIDAVGRKRGTGNGGGNDEREQTLNQILVEMDGFESGGEVIVIAATNRSDVLDGALLRPGRFDRKILVGQPDVREREAILKVHAKNKPLADDVDLKLVAKQTPGFAGADLANVLNEAALVAARQDKSQIESSDVAEAEDRVIAGPAKKDRKVTQKQREMVAYHEAGHTIVGLVLSNARDVHKVTIVPRGRAGGYMIALPKDDQTLLSKADMLEQLAGLMGGRVAEEIIFDSQTTGASNDFEQATQMARAMVAEYGMSDKLGPVQYEGNHAIVPGDFTPKYMSEQTAYEIDCEVRALLTQAHDQAYDIIQANRDKHRIIAEALLEYETLDSVEIKSLYETGKMPPKTSEEERAEEDAMTFDEAKAKVINSEEEREEDFSKA